MDERGLRQHIITELDWEPEVDAANVGVALVSGIATLTGHVPSYAQRVAAERAVKRVKGVKGVAMELEVRPRGAASLSDEDIAARALNLLKWTTLPSEDPIMVVVSSGWITLSGDVERGHQSFIAEKVVRRLQGVKGVTNAINVRPQEICADAAKGIKDALERDASLEAARIEVLVEGGKVKLLGQVPNWPARDAVNRAAWAAPGVRAVEDHICID